MAITWGAWRSGQGGSQTRLGIEFVQSPSTVAHGTSSVTVRARVFLGYKGWIADNYNTLTVSGNFSFSGNVPVNVSGNGQVLLKEVSGTWNTRWNESFTLNASASLTDFAGGSPSHSATHRIGARPFAAPTAPSSVTVTRVSDTSHRVGWARTATTARPWTQVRIERWDNVSKVYAYVGQTSGTATTFTDNSTLPDRQYRYRVQARNNVGNSSYTYTSFIFTRPAAATSVKAARLSGGAGIRVSWGGSFHADATIHVYKQVDGVWGTSRVAAVPASAGRWDDTDTSTAGELRYRVIVSLGGLQSAWSPTSAAVSVLAPPLAPTNVTLSQGGTVVQAVDGEHESILSWTYNSADGSEQTRAEIAVTASQTSISVPAPAPYSVIVETSEPSHTFAPGDLLNFLDYSFQVRTWGAHDNPGAWSPWVHCASGPSPRVVINSPEHGSVVGQNVLPPVQVSWSSPFGPQVNAAEFELVDSLGNVLETKLLSQPSLDRTLIVDGWETHLNDSTSYQLRARVRSSFGMWSPWEFSNFTVTYFPPGTPLLVVALDERTATVSLSPEAVQPEGSQVETVELQVWRSEAPELGFLTGEAREFMWESTAVKLADGMESSDNIVDFTPNTGGTVYYRVLAISDTPSQAWSDYVPVALGDGRHGDIWINYGPGWNRIVRLYYDPKTSWQTGRQTELRRYSGRSKPVARETPQTDRTLTVSAALLEDWHGDTVGAHRDAVEDMSLARGPFLYRDPTGRKIVGHVSSVSFDHDNQSGQTSVSFTVTEVDHVLP